MQSERSAGRIETGAFGRRASVLLELAPVPVKGAVNMWWTRVWKWERIKEAVDLTLFRKRMWVKSVMQRGPRHSQWQLFEHFLYFFLCVSLFTMGVIVWVHLEVSCLCILNLLKLYIYIQFPTHLHADLVIATFFINHRLTHMFVKLHTPPPSQQNEIWFHIIKPYLFWWPIS